MALYKRGRVYHYRFRINGKRYRGSTKKTTVTAARRIEALAMTRAEERGGALLLRRSPVLREFSERIPNVRITIGQDDLNEAKLANIADSGPDLSVRELRPCNEDPMSTQPNRIISRERLYPIREAPVNQKHAARFLNMHPKTVLRKAREGSLPAHPVGTDRKRWHFYLSELDQWLRSQVISGSHPRRQPQGDYIG